MSETIGENGFRDFVITTMENTLKFMVIVFTCSGGVFGAMIAFMIEAPRSIYFAQTAASHVWTWTFVGFIIGAVAGFVFSATLAGIAFSLAETAENTRKVALVLGGGGTFAANSAPVVWNNAQPAPTSDPSVSAAPTTTARGEELSAEARAAIDGAKEAGYRVAVEEGNIVSFISTSGSRTRCRSNQEILRAAKYAHKLP